VKTRLKKNIITRVDNELIVNTMNDVNFCYDEKVKFTIHPKLTNEELLNDTFYASKNGCLVLLKIDQMLSNIEELKLNK
jgi:hypothetical protein